MLSLLFDAGYLLLAGPVFLPYLVLLVVVRRRGVDSLRARFGALRLPAKRGPRLWIHAVSVGELEAAGPLLSALEMADPSAELVVSCTTASALETARRRYGGERVFPFPVDLGFAVRRVLNRVDPDLVALVELEIWPQHVLQTHRRGVPLIVVNGRISERGARRMGMARILFRPLLRRITRFLVQSDEYRQRLQALGVDGNRIEVAGNLKFDRHPPGDPRDLRREFDSDFGWETSVPRWIGGSTHPGEEELLLAIHRRLRASRPELRLILAPRHVERTAEILRLTEPGEACTLSETRRFAGEDADPSPSVVVVDAVGELAALYAGADCAFVGGSLVPVGGHNVLEPMVAGTVTLHGPHMENFRRERELFTVQGGCLEVENASALEARLAELLDSPQRRREIESRAADLVRGHRGAAERTAAGLLRELARCLPSNRPSG